MRGELDTDRRIARLAEAQHGVVARRQLRAIGLSDAAIDRRLAAGRLHPVHRGVMSVGHRLLTVRGRWSAAVLAGGRGAALSHRSAAALWELRGVPVGPVEITVPGTTGRGRPAGLHVHRSATRDAVLAGHGLRVVRFTHRQVTARGAWVAERLRAALYSTSTRIKPSSTTTGNVSTGT